MSIEWLPELGFFALLLALAASVLQAVVPLLGAWRRNPLWMSFAQPMAAAQFCFVGLAYLALTLSFYNDLFSVAYVAQNSNSLLPWYYKLSAVWGGHEGSVLLWSLLLSAWGLAVAVFSGRLPRDLLARVLAVMGMIAVGFLAFVIKTSNPFARLLPLPPGDGADLNPLLQDPGLIVHPPMLYMGYVGFSVAFSFAIAALLGGRLDAAWTRWVRPWSNIAWAFLSVGIALGSWWAYYELGWGGWWFWDPVENASLMPWLAGTALIHSLAVTEKRGTFKSWTVLLAILTFSLSLLGTFLVRSGVLTSVHAFANDPSRGTFILVLLGITVGASLLLFALRAPRVTTRGAFSWISRDAMLLANNLLLLVMMLTVLLGTLYPLVLDALGLGQISVGPPYFNLVFVPLSAVLSVFMGLGPISQWKSMKGAELRRRARLGALAALVIGIAAPLLYRGEWSLGVSLGLAMALWIALPLGRDLLIQLRRDGPRGLKRLSRSHYGMVLGHLGLAVSITGVTLVSHYGVELNARMAPGTSVEVSGYRFTMVSLDERRGSNFIADRATIRVERDGRLVRLMHPEKRVFLASRQAMTETALAAGPLRDLYVALGEPLDGGAWAVRIQVKPFVRWLWAGALSMAIGGLLAASDKRYRLRRRNRIDVVGTAPLEEVGR
ncbi:heme lyase CcmF/NrfE family subunit [Halotalea alkalilenta]|uniref:heme lyase CcmF/NrfE family subunit n=1 Tax=Halotalea alkalilenta TaxID=376489 RepID=UPI0006942932|nr:heme lyase CcmF/NrfE family subunit [Halotalea alkalilenta]